MSLTLKMGIQLLPTNISLPPTISIYCTLVVIKSQSERCYSIPYILQPTKLTTNQIHYTLRITIEVMINAGRWMVQMAMNVLWEVIRRSEGSKFAVVEIEGDV